LYRAVQAVCMPGLAADMQVVKATEHCWISVQVFVDAALQFAAVPPMQVQTVGRQASAGAHVVSPENGSYCGADGQVSAAFPIAARITRAKIARMSRG